MKVKSSGEFQFIETGGGKSTLVLLHGLFGALSNFKGIIDDFGSDYNVVVPILPIYTLEDSKVGLDGLVDYVQRFIEFKNLSELCLLGNSLGGHVAQLYVLQRPELVNKLVLTGSSGLFESAMGDGYPRRGDYEYIKSKTQETFYDPETATEELIQEVYDTVNDRVKAIKIVITARNAVRHNMEDQLGDIKCQTLLVWGKQDTITPPFVAEKFHELLPDSRLEFIDKCGHAPMMERPEEFNAILKSFI